MDLTGLLLVIARRGSGFSNLCRLLLGRYALSDHLLHITLDRDASTSETSNATSNLFMDLLSRPRSDEASNRDLRNRPQYLLEHGGQITECAGAVPDIG
jgi:hypothetical protein